MRKYSILTLLTILVFGCTVLETYKGDPNADGVTELANPFKNSGVRYYRGDNMNTANNPDTLYGSEIAIFTDSTQLGIWDRANEVFVPSGGITTSKSDPSGAPATGQPWAHINTTTGQIRKWNGSAWESVAEVYTNQNAYWVDPNGDNSTGTKGRQNLKYADPWAVIIDDSSNVSGSTVYLEKGDYQFTGPYSTYNPEFSIASPREVSIIGPDASISYINAGVSGENNWISDLVDNNSFATSPRDFKLEIDSLNLTTTDGSLELLIAFYDSLSSVDIKADHINMTGSRNWIFQVESPHFNLDVKEVTSNGNMIGWSRGNKPGFNHRVNVDKYSGQLNGNDIAMIQNGLDGQDQYSYWTIGEIDIDSTSTGTTGLFSISGTGSRNTNIVKMGKVNWMFANGQRGLDDYTNSTTIYNQTGVFSTIIGDSSKWHYSIEDLRTDVPILGCFSNGVTVGAGSVVHIDLGKVRMYKDAPGFNLNQFNLTNGAKIIFECDDCVHEGTGSWFWLEDDGTTIDGTSQIIIKGNWRQRNGQAVINTNVDITLQGEVENDGTSASIQSVSGATVKVKGAFDANSIISDADVTIVRLDEYGASFGGGSGGGMFEAANDGGTVAVTNVELPSSFEMTGPSGGATQIYLDRYGDNANANEFVVRKGRGTKAAPTDVVANDQLGGIEFLARQSSAWRRGAAIWATVHDAGGDYVTTRLRFEVGRDELNNGFFPFIVDSTGLEVDGNILFSNSAAKINLTSQLEILGASGGTAQSRAVFNSTTAAGGTIIEDRDPGTPADAATLTLNWDGPSSLTTDDQTFTFGTGTAVTEFSTSTGLRFNNIGSWSENTSPTNIVVSNGSGDVRKTPTSYAFLILASETSGSGTATIGTELPVNSTGGAITITPPSSPSAGQIFAVFDSRGQAATNNITIDTSGDGLNGAAVDYVISTTNGYVQFRYIDATVGWRVKD